MSQDPWKCVVDELGQRVARPAPRHRPHGLPPMLTPGSDLPFAFCASVEPVIAVPWR